MVMSALTVKRSLVMIGAALLLLVGPSVLGTWMPVAMLVIVYAVAVAGFNLLFSAGQMSLGHAAFMGLGGFMYAYLAGQATIRTAGLGLPPIVAMVLAGLIVGLAGLAFSPLTSRLGGLSLAAASLGLVFLTDHVFGVAGRFSGGISGRQVTPLSLGPFTTSDDVTLWRFVLVAAGISFVLIVNLMNGRVGRALYAIRDGELYAPALGIEIRRYKASAFFVSSLYAGLSGAMLGLVSGVLMTDTFSLLLSLNILMMSILGGAAFPVGGALAGATVFVILPEVLRRYGHLVPFLAAEGSTTGITPAELTSYVFGGSIVLLLILEPDGLLALVKDLRGATRRRLLQRGGVVEVGGS